VSPLAKATRLYRRSKNLRVWEAKNQGNDTPLTPEMEVEKFGGYGVMTLQDLLNNRTPQQHMEDLMYMGTQVEILDEDLHQESMGIQSSLEGPEHSLRGIVSNHKGMSMSLAQLDDDESHFQSFWTDVGMTGSGMGEMRQISPDQYPNLDLRYE